MMSEKLIILFSPTFMKVGFFWEEKMGKTEIDFDFVPGLYSK
jgi:hypothetical protein